MQNRISEIKASFSRFDDWEEKYKAIIDMGKALPTFPEENKSKDLLVKGCQSQVWLKASFEDGKVSFKGESDSIIVQGLLALILKVYSDATPKEILETAPDFLEDLGLKKHLTPNRANGVYAMVKQVFYYAQAFQVLQSSLK